MKIGVISDTHNYLDPCIAETFSGVDHILHGGDVGQPSIIKALERIAPVTAVCGNTDDPAFGYRITECVALAGVKCLLHHIVNPRSLPEQLKLRIQLEKPRVVIFGHTHRPFSEQIDECLFLNPGYAGKQRFALNRSVAILHLAAGQLRPEFITL